MPLTMAKTGEPVMIRKISGKDDVRQHLAELGFVPQILVLFLLLAILEDVGYMARIAFIMDRVFRRFALVATSAYLIGVAAAN